MRKNKKSFFKMIFLLLLVLIGLGVIGFIVSIKNNSKTTISGIKTINSDVRESDDAVCFKIKKDGVYYSCGVGGSEKIEGVDTKTFKELDYGYVKDNNHVFYCGPECDVITMADVNTFEALGEFYAKDIKNIYQGYEILDVDYNSFKILGMNYYSDKNGIYFSGNKLKNADLVTFKVIGDMYGVDSNKVFYLDKEIIGADTKTFKDLGDLNAEDKNHKYFDGELAE
jgi:hypothetical protein